MTDAIPHPPAHLPEKQRIFYVRYLQSLNATQSAIDAGYAPSTADKKAYLWVGKSREACPKPYQALWDAIREAQESAIKKECLSEKWILTKLMEMAGFSPQDILDLETGKYLPLHEMPPEAAICIEGMSMVRSEELGQTEDGREVVLEKLVMNVKTIKNRDRLKALELLARFARIDPTADYKQPTSWRRRGPGPKGNHQERPGPGRRQNKRAAETRL